MKIQAYWVKVTDADGKCFAVSKTDDLAFNLRQAKLFTDYGHAHSCGQRVAEVRDWRSEVKIVDLDFNDDDLEGIHR